MTRTMFGIQTAHQTFSLHLHLTQIGRMVMRAVNNASDFVQDTIWSLPNFWVLLKVENVYRIQYHYRKSSHKSLKIVLDFLQMKSSLPRQKSSIKAWRCQDVVYHLQTESNRRKGAKKAAATRKARNEQVRNEASKEVLRDSDDDEVCNLCHSFNPPNIANDLSVEWVACDSGALWYHKHCAGLQRANVWFCKICKP